MVEQRTLNPWDAESVSAGGTYTPMHSKNKKNVQLGMNFATAYGRLRKVILFELVKELGRNFCFQCGAEIITADDLSIEHKVPWLDSENPVDLFFNLKNIAFSHLGCNSSASRVRPAAHPSITAYRNGCRCRQCKDISAETRKQERMRQRQRSVSKTTNNR